MTPPLAKKWDAYKIPNVDGEPKPAGIPLLAPGWETELDALRFDPTAEPPEERTIYRLGDAVIATPGNIVGFTAQAKAGKTALLGAIIASSMQPAGDCLGVHSTNDSDGAVVVFDTEQSPRHFFDCITRALYRAGKPAPGWLRAYHLKSKSVKQRRLWLAAELQRAGEVCGSVHSSVIDGLGDLCKNTNDQEEAVDLIQELGELAEKHRTVILCVLHENPGIADTGKGGRGHLGSELERKAESNLRLQKDAAGVTTVFSERSRGAHIPKNRGPRFQWSDEKKMHVSVETVAAAKGSAIQDRQRDYAAEVFRDCPEGVGLTWAQVHERIEKTDDIKRSGARKRFDKLVVARVIWKSGEKYRLA